MLDEAVLEDPVRLAAVYRAREALPSQRIPLAAIARLAARLLNTPMAAVTLVSSEEEFFVGGYGLPESLSAGGRAPLTYSVCKYIVAQDHPLLCADMPHDDDIDLRGHPLVTEYGVRAFLGVPVRDDADRPLGSMTVLDTAARQWTDDDLATLLEIAELLRPAVSVETPVRAPAEEQAERTSSFLTTLLDSLSVGVIACDDTGTVVEMNRVLRETQGLSATDPLPVDYPASVRGMLYDAGMRPMSWEQTPLMRAFRGEHVSAVDVLTMARGEPVRTFATIAAPMIAADGRRLGAVAVAHELTAMRRAERFRTCHLAVLEALRSADTEVEAAPAVLKAISATLGWPCAELFLIDEATGHLRSVGHWDASGHDADGFFGHIPIRGTGVTGQVWQSGEARWVADIAEHPDLNTEEFRTELQAWLRRGIRTVLAVPVHDGQTLLGVLTCYANAQEQHEKLLTVLLDGVAAQIGVYVGLRRAEQLAGQLTRAQDDFIALVGHEMRTPLTSITANVTMLGEDASTLDDDGRQMLRSVARNAAAMQKTVDSLLDLAGLDSGYLRIDLDRVDLVAVIAGAVAAVRHAAADTGVLVRTDLPARLLLDGDLRRLRQVVDDLLSNAVKYSPLGGQVRIQVDAGDGMAELCITDTGIGIVADERDRVYDRFFRGSNVRHQGTVGSGLGLSLAGTIVRLHRGTIHLTGNEPSGTVVRVRLPLRAAPRR